MLFSCTKSIKRPKTEATYLFTELPPSETRIHFINELPENSAMNSMVYEYFYNGGGVAIGDMDNDGLPDIYLTANLKGNKLYKNLGNFKFQDITTKANVESTFGWTTGVTMADVNADGWLDIYVCKSGKGKIANRKNLLYINNKNGTFTERASEYGLDFPGYSTQASFFDYDKDGDLDMFLLNHNVDPINTNNPENFKEEKNEHVGDCLFRNDGEKFTNVSEQAGISQNSLGFGLGVSVGDVNQDGWPDIYVGNDYIEQDYLYFNNGDGTFSEKVKSNTGHTSNFSMGTDIADINNDGFPEIISLDMVAEDNYGIKTSMSGMNPKAFNHAVDNGFHYQYMFNALQLNNGNGHFSEIGQMANISNTDWSWAPLLADFDNDGLKDLFVTNGLKRDFRNNDFKKYKLKRLQEAQDNGEKMPRVIEELVQKTPQRKTQNYFFKNNGDLTYTKTSAAWGLTKTTFSNGAAYADLDNDGDLDLVINNIDEKASILRNDSHLNFIQFQLKGDDKNPFGIGAKISIETEKGNQYVENHSTRGYQSAVAPLVHFGLSYEERIKQAIVKWPDGKIQVVTNIPSNQRLTINYKDAVVQATQKTREKPIFTEITQKAALEHSHQENAHNDFALESLLPHKMSEFGPALAVADVNGDGLMDFFVGGAKGFSASLYLQKTDGTFSISEDQDWMIDKEFEDVDAIFFDVDKDGDQDLYVVSGGNEHQAGHENYQDRLYINIEGKFKRETSRLPKIALSGSCAKPFDFDKDGDLDLFIGTRQQPQKYPYSETSLLLENLNGVFKDVTNDKAPDLAKAGMVTDAIWTDFNSDGQTDLILVGEWTKIAFYKNNGGVLQHDNSILPNTEGWWNSISGTDFDLDGDMDYVVGNLGLNYKYKASEEAPFEVYSTDFDDNGTNDIVLGYYNQGSLFPLRGRECSSQQMPFLKEKFPSYHSFGSAKLVEVYGKEKLEQALHLKSNTFASVYLENLGSGNFKVRQLPNKAQLSSINAIQIDDFDQDGIKDILVAGNLYQSEVETPRNDASIGLFLKGNGSSKFNPIPFIQSGVFLNTDVKKMRSIRLGKSKKAILVASNNNSLKLIAAE
ncbi:VCBS repeat-containing protein [Flagellimonas sp.]|uniref:VCBS repeat-containing protein n=1 Tax=Flagellimonas sp. TaxID=2058762 RepID=UPI003B500195